MNKALRMFEEDLRSIEPCSDEEMRALLAGDRDDEATAARFMEGNLYRALRIANEFGTDLADPMDLVQEGSIAILSFFREEKAWTEDSGERLDSAIRSAASAFAEEEKLSLETAKELASKLNMLDFLTTKIAEKTGREATIEELSQAMDLPEDEIEYLLHEALTAVNKED